MSLSQHLAIIVSINEDFFANYGIHNLKIAPWTQIHNSITTGEIYWLLAGRDRYSLWVPRLYLPNKTSMMSNQPWWHTPDIWISNWPTKISTCTSPFETMTKFIPELKDVSKLRVRVCCVLMAAATLHKYGELQPANVTIVCHPLSRNHNTIWDRVKDS